MRLVERSVLGSAPWRPSFRLFAEFVACISIGRLTTAFRGIVEALAGVKPKILLIVNFFFFKKKVKSEEAQGGLGSSSAQFLG